MQYNPRNTHVYIFVIILAIVIAGISLATIIVSFNDGYFLDLPGRTHIQELTGVYYGASVANAGMTAPSSPRAMPTPSPETVTPTQVPSLSIPQIINLVFCGQAGVCPLGGKAERVATCMTGLNPNAMIYTGGMGLFGLRALTWAQTPYASRSPYNPTYNTKAALWLYQKSGNSWYRWGSCSYA